MAEKDDHVIGAQGATELFEEYLALRERGDDAELTAFLDRAGPLGPELRERAELVSELEDLGKLLAGPEEQPREPALNTLGRYTNLEEIGRGGLSVVYRAHDTELGRTIALKVLSEQALPISDLDTWRVSESQSLASVQSDSVVRLFDTVVIDGRAAITMEYVDGPSLKDVMAAFRGADEDDRARQAAERLRPIAERCQLIVRLARALHECHLLGVIHRDIKPENVLIAPDGTPKIIDFGLAHQESNPSRLGLTQHLVGTPGYISPEQVDSGKTGASAKSDQFSLGVVLYELLARKNPFHRDTREATLTQISRALPPPLRRVNSDVPADVARICHHALERDPDRRYPDLAALADDLEAFLSYRSISLRPPGPVELTRLWLSRHRAQVIPAAVAATLLVSVAVGVAYARARDHHSETLRRTEALASDTAAASSAAGFQAVYEHVDGLRTTALLRDESAFSGWALSRLTPAVDREVEALSVKAIGKLDQEFETARDLRIPAVKSAAMDTVLSEWAGVLTHERSLNPGGERFDTFHEMGRITIPNDAHLLIARLTLDPLAPAYESIPSTHPIPPGDYRVVTNEGVLEFNHRRSNTTTDYSPAPFATDLRPTLVPVAGRSAGASGWVYAHTVESFQIMSRPVSWGDVLPALDVLQTARLCAGSLGAINRENNERLSRPPAVGEVELVPVPRGLQELDALLLQIGFKAEAAHSNGELQLLSAALEPLLDEPAAVRWTQAQRIANSLGGRLPTPLEFVCAVDRGVLRAPQAARGELTSARVEPGYSARAWFEYDDPAESLAQASPQNRRLMAREMREANPAICGVYFRLVSPALGENQGK